MEETEIIKREQLEVINDNKIETQAAALRDCLKEYWEMDSINGGPQFTMYDVNYLRLLEINPQWKGSLTRDGIHLLEI